MTAPSGSASSPWRGTGSGAIEKGMDPLQLQEKLNKVENEEDRKFFELQWSKPRKYYDGPKKKGDEGGRFAIIIDPSKCKGCAIDDDTPEETAFFIGLLFCFISNCSIHDYALLPS